MPFADTMRAVSWNLIVLVLGLFLVVQAVENTRLAGIFTDALHALAPGDSLSNCSASRSAAHRGEPDQQHPNDDRGE